MNEISRQNSYIEFFFQIFSGLTNEEKNDFLEKIKQIMDVSIDENIKSSQIYIGSGGTLDTYYTKFIDKQVNLLGVGFTKERAINSLFCQYYL